MADPAGPPGPATGAAPIAGAAGLDTDALARFLGIVGTLGLLFGAAEAVLATAVPDPRLPPFAAMTLGVGLVVLAARAAALRGRAGLAVALAGAALLGIGLAATAFDPALAPAMVLLPVIAAAIALPFLEGPALRALLVAGWAGATLIGAMAQVLDPGWRSDGGALAALTAAAISAAAGLAMLLLGLFHARLTATLRATRAANEALDAARRSLQAQNQRLREAEEARARFINAAAHELNTPLTPIQLQLAALRAGPAQLPGETLAILDRNVARLAELVHDLLEAARIHADRVPLAPEPVDLAAIARDAVATWGPVAEERGIALEARAAEPVPALADPRRVVQVLWNLVANALAATPAGGRVVVEAAADPEPRVRVLDTGDGFAAADARRLFQPFSQLDPPRNGPRGTGLGLAISKGLVEAHGGRIWAESPGLGQGATFSFTLPRAQAGPRPADASAPTPA